MSLASKTLYIKIAFERPAFVDTYSAFVIRSVLGYQLRRMHCVAHTSQCTECVFRHTCAYALIFETIIEKDSPVLPGRDRASHPFRLFCPTEPGTTQKELQIMVQLFGKGCDYIPHVIYAIREGGKQGLFRSRTPYTISVFNSQNQAVLDNDMVQLQVIPHESYQFPESLEPTQKTLNIHCTSPLRFKVEGRYRADFFAADFVMASLRRQVTLFSLFGTESANKSLGQNMVGQSLSDLHIIRAQRQWKDYTRYSGRQKTLMKMGGVVGDFSITGTAPSWVWECITLAGVLGSGKNTSFGFGNIQVREVKDGVLH